MIALLDPDPDPAEFGGATFARGAGCSACLITGYLGQSGIFEVSGIDDTLREIIFPHISQDVLQRVAVDLGMRRLRQAAVDKVIEGVTTLEEVFRVVPM